MTVLDLQPSVKHGCVFCDIAQGIAPATIVEQWPDALAIVPLGPVTPGHVLVIPRVHVEHFAQAPIVTGQTAARAAQYAARHGDANLITSRGPAATQTVKHLHWHVVPRAEGDDLPLPWTGQER